MSRTGSCPSCGASLTFEVGSSRAAVCRFCHTLVARRGQDLASAGRVADLTPTGTRVSLGAAGRYLGERFTVRGRLQLDWTAGVWDEWYVSFSDGRWGWLAEAGGRYYLTFAADIGDLPARDAVRAEARIKLGNHGAFVVTDIKQARVVGAEGELPEEIPSGEVVTSVDLDGPKGSFATIDYGRPGDDPTLFVGREIPAADLDLTALTGGPAPAAPEGEALVCKNCGAPLTIRVPGQTVRLVCGSCNALLDAKASVGKVIKILQRYKDDPPIPIGRTGRLRGNEWMVVGWMKRSCKVDFVEYPWDELLLYDRRTTALAWLVCSEGNWSLARSISAGDVAAFGNEAEYKDRKYRRFSSVIGEVKAVLGEFPWKVKVGETAQLEDYVAPPEGLSVERNGAELSWSHVHHLDVHEVVQAFKVEREALPRAKHVGAFQPWPYAGLLRNIRPFMIGGVAAVLLTWLIFAARGQALVVDHMYSKFDVPPAEPTADGAEPPPPPSRLRTFVSEPFELRGHRAVEVRVVSDVNNSWAYVDGALVKDDTGDAHFFGLETAYYSGVEGGESWSEGSRKASVDISAPPAGTYVLRADLQWDPGAYEMPHVTLEVHEGGASASQLWVALAIILSPLLLLIHRQSFNKRRWEESNVSPPSE